MSGLQAPSMQPLIPLPETTTTQPATDDKDDLFATLFSPATPPASPTPGSGSKPTSPQRLRPRHSRGESTDSDFGAFVSVPSTEHPLHTDTAATPQIQFSPLQNSTFLDKLAEDSKEAASQNKRGVLDELLELDEDPLHWLHTGFSSTNDTASDTHDSGAATPVPAQAMQPPAKSPMHFINTPLLDLSSNSKNADLKPSSSSTDIRQSRLHTRADMHAHTHAARTPSLPPSSPTRLSAAEIQRTQSFFTPSSFPSRWVSSLLSSASRRGTIAPSGNVHSPEFEDDTMDDGSDGAIYAGRGKGVSSVQHSRAQTDPGALDSAITHGSPFAAHPFVSPSGAPGFEGDHTWGKGFEFDSTEIERKSVRLVGRREMTIPLLSVSLADSIRPYFPALARLPRVWTLLYSLDQHGISLHTLYSRCAAHTGGTLVVVRDAGDALFGVWMGDGVRPSKGAYYGSGESFLWRQMSDGRVRVYKWTGKNDYVALCEPEYISFGGGDGLYGLYLDDTLSDGSSAPCPTFENEPLCSEGPHQGGSTTFECVGLEVWGVG